MTGFTAAFRAALNEVLTTRALLSTMVVAVLFYAFYYPAPYRHQSVVDLPIVVVDDERTPLTADLVRKLDDTPEVAVVALAPSQAEALQWVTSRRAEAVLHLGDGLSRRLLTGSGTGGLSLTINGSYLLRARGIGVAAQHVVESLLADRLEPLGLEPPLRLAVRPLFNPTTGYADYIFPAVSVVILQQTLLFGAAMLMGRRRARGEPAPSPGAYLGTLAAMTVIGIFGCAFYFGFVFWLEDMPRGGNIAALLVAMPVFSLAVAALGLLIGSFLDEGDRAMELLVPTSVVLFFLTGAAWPTLMMPGAVKVAALVSPATQGVPLFVGLNQMAASLADVAAPLARLALLALAYMALGLLRTARLSRS